MPMSVKYFVFHLVTACFGRRKWGRIFLAPLLLVLDARECIFDLVALNEVKVEANVNFLQKGLICVERWYYYI
jgi:hypothetical protein